jgi:hypothetical protein
MLPQNLYDRGVYTVSGLTATIAHFSGTYSSPITIGAKYLWYDATNNVFRVKSSAPSSETDGNVLTEGTLP